MAAPTSGNAARFAARFATLPRVTRWVLSAALFIAAYFGVIEPVLDRTNQLWARGDANAASLVAYEKNRAALTAADADVKLGLARYGSVEGPGDPEARPVEFNRMIDALLDEHGITDASSTSRTVPLGNVPLSQSFGPDFRVDRLVRELQFEAAPEALSAFLADAERRPLVTTVSRLNVRAEEGRGGRGEENRLLRVSLAVETWLLVRKGARK